jgi:hypothetical protein
VAKINAGNTPVYATYIGGSESESLSRIVVNGNREAFASFLTNSTNLPVVDPIQGGGTAPGPSDSYIVRLAAAGNSRLYATYLGGGGADQPFDIELIDDERAVVVGSTTSNNFPTANPLQANRSASFDSFVSILAPPPVSPPTNLTALVISAKRIRLNWNNGGGTPTEFRIERATGTFGFVMVGTVGGGVTQFEDVNATSGGTFSYQVRAADANSVSGPSNEVTVTIPTGGKLKVAKKLNFGKVAISAPKTKVLKIQNTGKGMLLGFVNAPTGPYQLVSGGGPFTLAPKAKLNVMVRFAPVAVGATNGTMVITSTDPRKEAVTVGLVGKGK